MGIPMPRVGIMHGEQNSKIVVLRWRNLGLDYVDTSEFTLIQFGRHRHLPLRFVCRTKTPHIPSQVRSIKWKITRRVGRLIFGTTGRPFDVAKLFRGPEKSTVPVNRRLHERTAVRS